MELNEYVKMMRMEQGFTIADVSWGLCSEGTLRHFESGKREIPFFWLCRVLARLGMKENAQQLFLEKIEYERWQERMDIIWALWQNEHQKEEMVHSYNANATEVMDKQFGLRMLAILEIIKGESECTIAEWTKRALLLTVPELDVEVWKTKPLALQELDMLLDYYYYRETDSVDELGAVVNYLCEYVARKNRANVVWAKAVGYYVRALEKQQPVDTWAQDKLSGILDMVSEVVESYRGCNNGYYLWELLEIRQRLLETANMDSTETIGFRRAVERACEDWKIEKETKVLWPLYTINNVEYIGEVLRKRRLVLGFSKEDLVEGICDLRTIQRYEAGTTCPRKYTAGQLLKKMGLPDVYLKRFFLTFESNQNKLFKAIRDNYNAGKYRNVVAMTEPLVNGKEKLEPYNYQRLMWYLLESKYKIKELSQEEWLEDMKENLSTTVEWKKILGSEAKYLSYNEVDYLTSILYNLDKKEADYMTLLFCVEKYAEEKSCSYQLINCATVLRVTMNMIQDAYADMELWEKTNMWCEKMLEVAGFFRNMRIFQDAIYNLWWNHKEEDKTTESVKPSYLVDLAKLMKDEENERFFASRFPED